MGLSRVYSRACAGVEAPLVTVEVHLGGGLPRMSMVGLPETAVREARDRVRSALTNSGFEVPARLITIALAPAELPKEGGGFDLPIALGILAASGQIPSQHLETTEWLGELSLSGDLRGVRGVLPAAIRASRNGRTIVIPEENEREASLMSTAHALKASSLLQVTDWLNRGNELETVGPAPPWRNGNTLPDLADVIGQAGPRRALEIAAAGEHNLLMTGPPGTGKSMLAARLPGILPPMSENEALETAAIASITSAPTDFRTWQRRPFRAPHHTSSGVALVGGGSNPRPGEISLAHNGVLFLDELPEFNRQVLEVLREPMESGRILISRAARQAEFPARFQLVCAMNPCPCGYAGDPRIDCRCSADQIRRYRSRISGPLLDRIDLQITVPRPGELLLDPAPRGIEDSNTVRQRVFKARELQLQRATTPNARMNIENIREHCRLGKAQRKLLESAADKLALSPRGCHKILKVARTIADLAWLDDIECQHLAEALSLRNAGQGGKAR